MHRILFVLLASLLTPVMSPADVTGSVTYKGKRWEVADGIAFTGSFDRISLAFAPVRWDRIAWADNGRFDFFAPYSFERGLKPEFLEIRLGDDGQFASLRMVKAFGESEGDLSQAMAGKPDRLEGIKIESVSSEAVAGHAKFERGDYAVDVKFDLTVIKKDAKVEVPGSALPADGGAPGKALLATLAAATAGDVPAMLALAHPDRREQMTQASATPEFAKRLAMMKSMTPTGPSISGGKIHEDHAWVDFSGNSGGAAKQHSAKLNRVAGVWYVERLGPRTNDVK